MRAWQSCSVQGSMVTVWGLGRIEYKAGSFAQNATPIAKPLGVPPYRTGYSQAPTTCNRCCQIIGLKPTRIPSVKSGVKSRSRLPNASRFGAWKKNSQGQRVDSITGVDDTGPVAWFDEDVARPACW
jgi:hypothetical protein